MGEMDSGNNSGSIQSSSTGGGGGGDDQEFESSRVGGGEPMPSFFNLASGLDNTVPFHLYSLNNGSSINPLQQTQQDDRNNPQISSYNNFNPLTYNNFMNNNNNIDNNNNINNNNINNDNDLGMVWANKYTSIKPTITCNNSTVDNHIKCTNNISGFNPNNINNNHIITRPPPLPTPAGSRASPPGSSDHQGPGGGGRNPKKRSRASRRAPTTVLTTDTNNFRQMVQEFTGIPAPPFSGRTRLDLFGGLGIQFPRNNHGGGLFESPPYLLRPFPQKIVPNNQPTINSNVTPQQPTKFSNPPPSLSSTTLRPNATPSIMNEFALGHITTTTTAIATATAAMTSISNTSIGSGGNNVEGMLDYSWVD